MQNYFQKLFSVLLLSAVLSGSWANSVRGNAPLRFAVSGARILKKDSATASAEVRIPSCPDANGVLRGAGKMITAQSATEFEITGYVTDAAELSHFDMTGATRETLTGGGRARRISVSVEKSTTGASKSADRLGKITFAEADPQMAEILKTEARTAAQAIFEQASARFRAAREEWRGGACVEVRMTAAKTKLMPGEKIVVTAESLYRQEKAMINSLLSVKNAVAVAAPLTQPATPRANFKLTAPGRGMNASIVVESISKRGIGTAKLEFLQDAAVSQNPPTKPDIIKPPIKDPKNDKPTVKCRLGGWYGTISLETKIRRDKPSGASGKAPNNAVDYREKVYKIDYQVFAQRDAAVASVNAFYAEAKVYYSDKHYRSAVYRPHKCVSATNRIYDLPELKQEYVNKSEARGSGRVTIHISAYEKNGSFHLFAPKALGESFYEQAFSSSCPTTDEPNTYRRPRKSFEWQFGGLLVEFVNESAAAGVLSGSKTIRNADGSETTIAWNLKGECQ